MWTNRLALALAAGLGLGVVLAVAVVLVWWNVSARRQPLQVVSDDAALEALLDGSPFIALNDGDRPVYLVAPRDAAGMEEWLVEDAAELAAQGRQLRVVLVPSSAGGASDEASVAELWLSRNIDLLEEWLSMPSSHWSAIGIPAADSEPERLAAVAEARAMARTLMRQLGQDATDDRWPVLVWRDGAGQLAACLCRSPEAAARARHALRLSERRQPPSDYDEAAVPRVHAPEAEDDGYDDLYPRLEPGDAVVEVPQEDSGATDSTLYRTPSPTLPGDVDGAASTPTPASRATERATAPVARRPAPRGEVNTAPPKAEKDAESLFY